MECCHAREASNLGSFLKQQPTTEANTVDRLSAPKTKLVRNGAL